MIHCSHVFEFFRFNPRARGGRDAQSLDDQLLVFFVSIHAPAEGATGRCVIPGLG